jgi:tRNA(Ile)-lysidine synthase
MQGFNSAILNITKKYLVAVSGGPDSMALLHKLFNEKYSIEVAHINYGLRANESDIETELVKKYCTLQNIPCNILYANTQQEIEQMGGSLQMVAREIRYTYFEQLVNEKKLHGVILAHHAKDQVETLLIKLSRGAGIAGLQAMLPTSLWKTLSVYRPLLQVAKAAIDNYVQENEIPFGIDSSNAVNKYKRNAIRNILLPNWEQIYPDIQNVLLQNISIWQQYNSWANKLLKKEQKQFATYKNGNLILFINYLKNKEHTPLLLHHILAPLGINTNIITAIPAALFNAENGKMLYSDEYRIIKYKDTLIVNKISNSNVGLQWVMDADKELRFNNKLFTFEVLPLNVDYKNAKPNELYIDAAKIAYPLCIRPWQLGDYMYPLGLGKKVKINRILIKEKTSVVDKEDTLVLEANHKIIWLVNKKVDDRFKITTNTKTILKITYYTNK